MIYKKKMLMLADQPALDRLSAFNSNGPIESGVKVGVSSVLSGGWPGELCVCMCGFGLCDK